MYASQIFKCLKSNPLTSESFKGVYSADESPLQTVEDKKNKRFYIFNLSDSDEPGSHWIAIMKNPCPSLNFYFDSYGDPPPPDKPVIKNILNCNYVFNPHQLQSPFSTVCGQWCMFFIAEMCCGVPFSHMIQGFEKFRTFLEKDYVVNRFVFQVFQLQLDVIDRDFLLEQIQRSQEKLQYGRRS